ncbi:GPW/gp25 family protein [Candidatus Hepatincolaceae symbiont of Richtersius coronifer]
MDLYTGKVLNKQEDLNQSIKLILLTPKGECILNRNFGSEVFSYVSQPINYVAMQLSAEVISSLEKNDKRIKIDNVSLQNLNNGHLNVEINYNAGNLTNVEI